MLDSHFSRWFNSLVNYFKLRNTCLKYNGSLENIKYLVIYWIFVFLVLKEKNNNNKLII